MKKVLFTSHLANFVKFNKPYMQWFQEQGWEVHYASQDEESIPFCNKHFKIDIRRSPFSIYNAKAYFQLKKIINCEHYDLIHCHTPMGGVVTRLAAIDARKHGTKVIYTAHGFHFYKGASLINWILYYPAEKWLSRYTDCLITMNEEDYQIAIAKHFRAGNIKKIDGVGVNLMHFSPPTSEEKQELRAEFGFEDDDFIMIYVAEFIPRKNHKMILRVLPTLIEKIPNLKVVFAGNGEGLLLSEKLAHELGVAEKIYFLGYRSDVNRLYKLSDILVSASKQEGLPMNIIEGMASGLPVICTRIRGQTDIIINGKNGFVYALDNAVKFCEEVNTLYRSNELCEKFGNQNFLDAQRYSVEKTVAMMAKIYMEVATD